MSMSIKIYSNLDDQNTSFSIRNHSIRSLRTRTRSCKVPQTPSRAPETCPKCSKVYDRPLTRSAQVSPTSPTPMAPVRRTAKAQPLSKDENALLLAAVRLDAAFRYLEQNGVVENDKENFLSCLEEELVCHNIFSKTLEFNAFNTERP